MSLDVLFDTLCDFAVEQGKLLLLGGYDFINLFLAEDFCFKSVCHFCYRKWVLSYD